MKRALAVLLCLCVALSVSACDFAGKEEPTYKDLQLGVKNTVEGVMDFTLFKIATDSIVTASLSGGLYYENETEGETYVDVVLDLTNIGTEAMRSDTVVDVYATSAAGTQYTRCLYAMETENSTSLSQYQNINPLTSARLHCAVSVPEAETAVTLSLAVNDVIYTCAYTLGDVVGSAKAIAVDEELDVPDYAKAVFKGVAYTDDVVPSDTSGAYTHYEIDNDTETYLAVKFDVTNYMSNSKDCEAFVGVKAKYMGKYTYRGFVVAEDEDGKGFSSYDEIAPLGTRHLYFLIRVPKTVVENEVTLTISFDDKEYTYTHQ